MSDIAIEDTEAEEEKVDFKHYVAAAHELVEVFRDELAEHTARFDQKAIELGGKTTPKHIQEAAELHRMRVACDNFCNALNGNY
jgi:hypothetical protein